MTRFLRLGRLVRHSISSSPRLAGSSSFGVCCSKLAFAVALTLRWKNFVDGVDEFTVVAGATGR
jgi:hypothetical protein